MTAQPGTKTPIRQPDPITWDEDTDTPAHYIKRVDSNGYPNPDVTAAYIFGHEVEAVCGERFVPTRDPEQHPLCSECKRLVLKMMEGA